MSYLINETTREEREQLAKKALAVSLSGADYPSKDTIDLVNEYIDGNMELEEIEKIIIKKYKHDKKEDN